MSHSSLSYGNRLIDNTINSDLKLCPIFYYENEIIVSLEKSIELIEYLFNSLRNYVKIAKDHCYYLNKNGLTRDQSASIYLYSMKWDDQSFYLTFNIALRARHIAFLNANESFVSSDDPNRRWISTQYWAFLYL